MQEILKKANDLVDTLTLRIRHYEAEKKKAEGENAKAEKSKNLLDAKLSNLEDREKEVKEREQAVTSRENLEVLEKRVKGDRDGLASQKSKFEKDQAAALKKIDDDQKALDARKKKVQERERQLDQDRRVYKDQLQQQMIKDGWRSPEPT